MNTIRMHRIGRAVLQKFAWLLFAVSPHPLAFDALPPPPSFCLPPPVRCAPGDMQKTKFDLRQLERNEHDTYAQNRESGTAEICMVTSCCCSSSTCFGRFAASAFFPSASSRSVRSWRHAKKKNPISVTWKEMNTIGMHRIERAVLKNFAWLPFAVALHPLAFDALPPPPSFCLPPLVRCAPGDMQKSKSDLRKSERNEHDTYAQNRESVTAELRVRSWKVTFCSCSSSACF